MDDKRFECTLENLCKWSKDWIVVYSWKENPFQGKLTDGISQYFRPLHDYFHIFEDYCFDLWKCYKVPFDDFGMIYFLRTVLY